MTAHPKPPKPWRSKSYRAWVRTLPCVGCGHPNTGAIRVVAHHAINIGRGGTMGGKADDRLAMPTCNRCHRVIHTFSLYYRENQIKWAMQTQRAAVAAGMLEESQILEVGE